MFPTILRTIIDLSQPVGADTPVYPGDGPVRITRLDQAGVHVSRIDLSVHTGTHMDAPDHFIAGGATIDGVPLERCLAPARVIDLRGDLRGVPARGTIRREHLVKYREALGQVRAAVLQTGWSKQWGAANYFFDHPALAEDAAAFLVDRGIELVGVDMPSVDHAPYAAHRVLLGAGVLIVENLTNLDAVGADPFELAVLPLKLVGRDGSPVRAVAIVNGPVPGA